MMKRIAVLIIFVTCLNGFGQSYAKPYAPNWESLSKYDETAEWFKDAKFGIFAHWGVMSVPAYGNDWYPRNMHIEGSPEYEHHLSMYGHPSKFGYHDFVPLFKAEKFDADEWAELFKKAGAKFAGLVAEHHDGWSNWDSKINPWNSKAMGPRKDIMNELGKAIHSREMKFVATFHKERNLQVNRYKPGEWKNDISYFPYNPKMPTSSNDPLLAQLYGNIPADKFYENWYGELKELIDNYSPDLIYFDGLMSKIPEKFKQEFIAYYFNNALKENKQVVITHKEGELPKSVSIEDLEKGRMNAITKDFWLTDETISTGSWSYTEHLTLKSANEIIDLLADIISKNGVLMLNVSPMANGIIPKDQQDILLDIGTWLEVNGEAVYGSRAFTVFGEGPTRQEYSGMFMKKITYGAQDIRYTTKGDTVYAIVLGWPGENVPVVLSAFGTNKKVPKVKKVSILGNDEDIVFTQDAEGIRINTPPVKVDDKAYVIKLEVK